MSTSWSTQYLSALSTRDTHEHTSRDIYTAYAALADRTAAEKHHQQQQSSSPATIPSRASTASTAAPTLTPPARTLSTHNPNPNPDPETATLRADLAVSQKRRSEAETLLISTQSSLERIRGQLALSERRVSVLMNEKAGLGVRLRDRGEELRGKAKLVQDVHDEAVALELQVNVFEERIARLEGENRELIARWMARVGREADAINEASKFS